MRVNRLVGVFLVSPLAALLLFAVVFPSAILFIYSFYRSAAFTPIPDFNFDSYLAVFGSTNGIFALNTFYIALPTMVLSVTGGLMIAYYIRFCAVSSARLLYGLVIVSLMGSFLVRMYSWRTLLGEQGIINGFIEQFGLADKPLGFLLFNRAAVVVGETNYLMPFCALVFHGALTGVSQEVRDAARDLGAGRLQVLRRVTLPIIGPAVLGAASFTFFLSCSDYITPVLLGGANSTTFGTLISDQLRVTGNIPLGGALAFVMAGAFVVFFFVARTSMRVSGLLPKPISNAPG